MPRSNAAEAKLLNKQLRNKLRAGYSIKQADALKCQLRESRALVQRLCRYHGEKAEISALKSYLRKRCEKQHKTARERL